MYRFSKRSRKNLKGVDVRLVILMSLMLEHSPYDFIITEGLRTKERQKKLVAEGKSKTMNSKHLLGRAVDIALIVDGKVSWDYKYYKEFTDVVKELSKLLKIEIIWGGDWKTFIDAPHIQLV